MTDDILYRVAWHRLGSVEHGEGEWVELHEARDELEERKVRQPDLHYWIEDDAGPRCRKPDALGRCMCDPACND